jgi:hypothetical protein
MGTERQRTKRGFKKEEKTDDTSYEEPDGEIPLICRLNSSIS